MLGLVLPTAASALTVVYPVEAIADFWVLRDESFKEKYGGINVTGMGIGDEGWYIRYRHENLTFFFGPIQDRDEARARMWELESVRSEVVRQRPALATSQVDMVRYDFSTRRGEGGDGTGSGNGRGRNEHPDGRSPDGRSGPQGDMDGDGIPNALDGDMDGDGTTNGQDGDMDGDGTANSMDDYPYGTGPGEEGSENLQGLGPEGQGEQSGNQPIGAAQQQGQQGQQMGQEGQQGQQMGQQGQKQQQGQQGQQSQNQQGQPSQGQPGMGQPSQGQPSQGQPGPQGPPSEGGGGNPLEALVGLLRRALGL